MVVSNFSPPILGITFVIICPLQDLANALARACYVTWLVQVPSTWTIPDSQSHVGLSTENLHVSLGKTQSWWVLSIYLMCCFTDTEWSNVSFTQAIAALLTPTDSKNMTASNWRSLKSKGDKPFLGPLVPSTGPVRLWKNQVINAAPEMDYLTLGCLVFMGWDEVEVTKKHSLGVLSRLKQCNHCKVSLITFNNYYVTLKPNRCHHISLLFDMPNHETSSPSNWQQGVIAQATSSKVWRRAVPGAVSMSSTAWCPKSCPCARHSGSRTCCVTCSQREANMLMKALIFRSMYFRHL